MKKQIPTLILLALFSVVSLFASAGEINKKPAPDKTCIYMFSSPGYATVSGTPVLIRITCRGEEGTCWGIGFKNGRLYIDIYDFNSNVISYWISGIPLQEPSDPDGTRHYTVDGEPEIE